MIVVSVINNQYTTWSQAIVEVLDGQLVWRLVAIKVWQMRKGVSHTDDGIEATLGELNGRLFQW